jgi:xanthine dehydrogenase accessory factor
MTPVLEMKLDERCAVVALTHDPKLDDMALMEALKSPPSTSAPGSRANNAKRPRALSTRRQRSADRAAARPIGLYIGSRTPPRSPCRSWPR